MRLHHNKVHASASHLTHLCPPLRSTRDAVSRTVGINSHYAEIIIPIMPRDAVSRTANVERNGGHKWVNQQPHLTKECIKGLATSVSHEQTEPK